MAGFARAAISRLGTNAVLFLCIVLVPSLVYGSYMFFIATPRYVAEAKFAIRSLGNRPMGDLPTGLFTSMTSERVEDANQVLSFITSAGMLEELDKRLGFSRKAASDDVDFIDRLPKDASIEERLEHYLNVVEVTYDEHAGLFSLSTKALSPADAVAILDVIIEKSEHLINNISLGLAREQLQFIQDQAEEKRQAYLAISRRIVEAQNTMSLLNPTGDAESLNAVIYGLEGEIASDEAELAAKRSYLTEDSVEIFQLKERIQAKRRQVEEVRRKLVGDTPATMNTKANQFKTLELEAKLAGENYSSVLQSLVAARVEASQGLKKLIVVVKPFVPEESTEPPALFNTVTFVAFAFVGFGLILICIQIAREHLD